MKIHLTNTAFENNVSLYFYSKVCIKNCTSKNVITILTESVTCGFEQKLWEPE